MATPFEGPEKNLEMDFTLPCSTSKGCRLLTRAQLVSILNFANCQILSSISNPHMDAYVLSESSLFVTNSKIIIKTCGTTTLLKTLPLLLETTREHDLVLNWLSYSRKNYTFPTAQIHPHTSFHTEISYLNQTLITPGAGYVLGPITSDHWYVYVWDQLDNTTLKAPPNDRTVHILMQDLHPRCSSLFYPPHSADEMTKKSGIASLVPGASIDAYAFKPCGYSMNAILFESYSTIHITPESDASYASWETNLKLSSYHSIIRNVLSVFLPEKFTMTVYADEGGWDEMLDKAPFTVEKIRLPENIMYVKQNQSVTYFEGDYSCWVAHWKMECVQEPEGEDEQIEWKERSKSFC